MAISDMDVRKAFRRNNLKISDGAVASRIADLAEEFGYSATELSDKYDFYATNRCDAASAVPCVRQSASMDPAGVRTHANMSACVASAPQHRLRVEGAGARR